jgi:glycosyltransferase involved in cell wall biosynthesis
VRFGARPDAVTVVLNGIDADAFRRDRDLEPTTRKELGIEAGQFVIGSVGRLAPQKRFDILIDAVAELRSAYPELRLLIAGGGPLEPTLRAQIERLGAGDTCRLLGHTDNVSTLHHAFDLFVQASDYEGTSNAVLEAMALETPVVATDAGGTREQIDHGVHGLIVRCGDRQGLRAAIEQVLTDRIAARARATAARTRIEGPLSFEARMKMLESIYLDLAVSRRPSGTHLTDSVRPTLSSGVGQ